MKDCMIQVRYTREQKERWKREAAKRGWSLTFFIEECIEKYLSDNKPRFVTKR